MAKRSKHMPEMPVMKNDYQAEDDHRTLMRAEEVRRDPKRMRGAAKRHAKVTKELAGVGSTLHERAESPSYEAREEARAKKPMPKRAVRRSR